MSEYRSLRNETAPIKSGIRRSTVHSYGTTTSSLLESARTSGGRYEPTLSNCIKHILQPGETLQGIALRYGSSTHEIRRANRLLVTDNIHLRESLLIPVPIHSESDTTTQAVSNGSDSAAHDSQSNPACQIDYVDESVEGSANKTFSKPPNSHDPQPQAVCTVPKSRSEYALPNNHGIANSQSNAVSAGPSDVQSSATAPVPNAAGTATAATSSKQFFDKYDQFLADIKPNVNRMEEETERIAKQYSADSSTHPGDDDARSNTLFYRTANEVGRNTRTGGVAAQRPRTSQNGAQQNGSSSIFSRWFTFGSSQPSAARSNSNYVIRGYQSELERAEQTSISHRDEDNDFYSI